MVNEGLEEVVERSEYGEKYGFYQDVIYEEFPKGLSEDVVRRISAIKGEPQWMLQKRLTALNVFLSKPMPTWGADLGNIHFEDYYYYKNPKAKESNRWEDVPADIKQTFDKLGVPEAERKFFSGAEAQFDSSVVYSHINEELEKLGIIFTDTDTAVKKYPELMQKYWGKVIPPTDNKFAALNTATWSGGSFIYVPKGVKVPMPLNAYFRINAKNSGQFERTLIIADEGADVTYLEGCFTAGARITTENGEKKIEDINVNDKVLTHSGRHMKVYHVQKRPYSGKLYKIKYYGDTSAEIKVTEEHPFVVAKRTRLEYASSDWKTQWVPAKDIGPRDYLAMPINRASDPKENRSFDISMKRRWDSLTIKLHIDTDPGFFRLVGYYLSEGSISGGHYVNFTFNKHEIEYIQDTAKLIEKYFGKKPLVNKEYKNGMQQIVLCSTTVAKFFTEQFGKGALNKHIPKWVMKETREKQRELIKGFWRGDGSFMYAQYSWGSKRMFRMNTISEVLARQLRDMLLRLDIFGSINVANRIGKRHSMFTVYVGGGYLQTFAELVEFRTVIKVGGSHQQYLQLLNMLGEKQLAPYPRIIGDYAFVPIKEIESEDVSNVQVYNFSVEGDESYVAQGVAVHNCTAPVYASNALHSAVVELVAHEGAHIRYVTIQNWSKNVYNLVTQRAHAAKGARVEWIDANIGSSVNMKYPSIYLQGEGASGEVLSIAIAGDGQVQDSGGKIYHLAKNTTSKIISKSVSKGSGVTTFRGTLHVAKNAENVKAHVSCDALLLDEDAKTNTYPYNQINRNDAMISHEAKVGKISDEEIFYLMSRGISEDDAIAMIVLGFIDDLTKVLPVEYSLELKRLIKLDTSKGVG
jgi:Fe-S cluster assembly protein SufB